MPTATDLVGTWRVVGFTEWPDGTEQHPLGEHPTGYAIFDAAGRIFILLGKSPGRGVSAEEVAASFIAYFGTFKVDGDTLIVSIESGNGVHDVASVQTRTIALDGNALSIGVPGRFMASLRRA